MGFLWEKALEVARLEEWQVNPLFGIENQARLWWLGWVGKG
jgi:hypothetical protein